FQFPGHTEFLGALTLSAQATSSGVTGPVMMLAAGDLKAVPATVHLPLAQVPARLTIEHLVKTTLVTHQALQKDFGIAQPRVVLSGLNPHAGENGGRGDEEARIIEPAIRTLQDRGVDCRGPAPADTLFHPEARRTY